MRRHSYRITALIHTHVLFLEKVAHCNLTGKIKLRESDTHINRGICRIIESHRTLCAVLLLNILHKHIGTILALYNVCLQTKSVLVECNKFFVLHQLKRIALYVVHVAADEQRRTHYTPHTKVGLVLFLGQSATNLKHIHVVVTAIACIGRQVEALVDDTLY